MRDGDYWYALVMNEFAAEIHVDAWAKIKIDGRVDLKARFDHLPPNLSMDGLLYLQTLAHEAMLVVSDELNGLCFERNAC
jgi:hypothetical protein